ncbi:MAG: hypothetical protein HYT73_01450 [Candidatus Aenigmarchaeota archaeon]|nr:hypothetical protein [Candidatus Aenigmarchaeota archaeon]
MKYAIMLAFLIAASGCVSQSASYGGLVVSMFADPPQVFQNQATTLFIDMDNRDVKNVNNVVFEVFDTGIMRIMDGPSNQFVQSRCQDAGYSVREGDLLWNIVKSRYGITSNQEIAGKVNEIASYNAARLPSITIDNRRFDVADDPSTLVACETEPCDNIRGDVLRPGDVIQFPEEACGTAETATVSGCRKAFSNMKPKEFQTFSCRLATGSVGESVVNRISAKTTFSAELNAVQLIELISREEYERRKAAGTFTTAPRKYTYSDSNVALDIEFSEDLPVIERDGKRYFIHMSVRNAGNGYIKELEPGDFIVTQKTSESSQILPETGETRIVRVADTRADSLVRCDGLEERMSPIGDKFPRVTCEFVPPENIDVIGNYPMGVKINYDYETRQNLDIRIIK